MPWRNLGTVTLQESWSLTPEDSIGGEVFRLTHQTTVDPSINSCWLSRYFVAPGDGARLAPWMRIYPSTEPQIINLPLPQNFLEAGQVIFSLQFKLRFPYYPVPWQITVEEFF
ncbi:hypothetical protein HJG54_35270 (plasmid) [Leptolyngbya sp. NK1-12]|uniref:Uncharacterized protein n=1 Tax=Leptolyngbya sp. NK1-12 TaxID=2547451 RepID=A0AA96WRF2_9CYAN|nr:hypothetical protein [Leptolyngbya sp. NK1-12]WNZ28176.1 hypothetical protein HJG54_35270 [Leptolyngbya sp. NK1-12]